MTGTIKITGNVKLIEKHDCGTSATSNGEQNKFRFTIEKANYEVHDDKIKYTGNNGNDESILLGSSIALSQSYKSINRTTHVNKGDLIFFRSHNIKYGCGGKVKLANAQVKYTGFDQSV